MKKMPPLINSCVTACFILLAAITCSAQLTAESEKDAVSTNLIGSWKGEGKAFGMRSRVEMKWESVLDKKFVRLQYKTEMRSANGETQIFEGYAFYKFLGDGKYRAVWFDSSGDLHPVSAVFDKSTLTSDWGTPETELGRTLYRLTAPSTIEVIDYIRQKDGTWKEFSRAILKKDEN